MEAIMQQGSNGLLSVREAQEYYGVCRQTIYRMMKDGRLKWKNLNPCGSRRTIRIYPDCPINR